MLLRRRAKPTEEERQAERDDLELRLAILDRKEYDLRYSIAFEEAGRPWRWTFSWTRGTVRPTSLGGWRRAVANKEVTVAGLERRLRLLEGGEVTDGNPG